MSAPSTLPPAHVHQSMLRTVLAGLFGNLLEWYDYAVFGFLVGPIGHAFFPGDDPKVQILKAWGLFAVGFFARPVGGIVLGRLGDTKGRRWLLTVSVLAIALSTLVIGCLPGYAQIGLFAPVVLMLCRLTQGFSLGGEFTGSMAYTTEHAKPLMRGLISSSTALGTSLGFLTGSAAVMILDAFLTQEQVSEWGWRLPFLFSFLMALFGWWLRRSLHESEAGEAAKNITKRPAVLYAIMSDWRPSLQLFAIIAFSSALYYYVFNAAVISAKTADPANAARFQTANTIALIFVAMSKIAGGWMSDKMGRRQSALIFTVWGLVVMLPGWLMLSHLPLTPYAFLGAQLLMGIPIAMSIGMQGAMLVEMFPVANRVVSMSFAYSVSIALAGGIMPGLNDWFSNTLHMPILTMIWIGGLGLLALLVVGSMSDTTGRDLKL